jgi:hypothetical protein
MAKVERADKGQFIRAIGPLRFASFSILAIQVTHAGASIDHRTAKTTNALWPRRLLSHAIASAARTWRQNQRRERPIRNSSRRSPASASFAPSGVKRSSIQAGRDGGLIWLIYPSP